MTDALLLQADKSLLDLIIILCMTTCVYTWENFGSIYSIYVYPLSIPSSPRFSPRSYKTAYSPRLGESDECAIFFNRSEKLPKQKIETS